MENRFVSGIVVAVFLGVVIHTAASQQVALTIPGIPCSDQDECKDARLPDNARCQSSFCICPDANGVAKNCSVPRFEAKNAAYNPAASAHPCKIAQDCNLPNGICNSTNSQCACGSGYVMSSNAWMCLKAMSTIGSACENIKQCTVANSTCRNNQCLCDTGYHFKDDKCWKSIGFGDTCSQTQECNHVEHAECNAQRVCACKDDTVLNSDGARCLPVAKAMLDLCEESAQCSKMFADSACIEKRCECMENNHFEKSMSRCVSSRNLRDSCSADYECFQDQEEDAGQPQRCVDNVCACNENFQEEGGICKTSGASSLISGVLIVALLARIALTTS